MGRSPCCDKANVKKGPWAPEEDATLKAYIDEHGTGGNWIALPQKIGLKRCGKSCRLRWLNYLRPNIRHGSFSEEEDRIICSLFVSIGSRWSIIAAQLPGRTDNDIKNYWNTRLKKKLLGKQRKDQISCRKGQFSMKRGRLPADIPSSIIVSGKENKNYQDPYWPVLPVIPSMPNMNDACFVNDHASIRKLLVKLGGKFSSDDSGNDESVNMVSHFPTDTLVDVQASSQDVERFIVSSAHISPTSMLVNNEYNNFSIQEGESCTYPLVFEELYSSTNPQKMNEQELRYDEMCELNTSGSSVITSGDNMDWVEMSSLISNTTTSNVMNSFNYPRSLQQGVLLQDYAYDEDFNSHVH